MKVTSQLNQRAFALLVLSIASPWEQGALATEASETASYDFIIVGGQLQSFLISIPFAIPALGVNL